MMAPMMLPMVVLSVVLILVVVVLVLFVQTRASGEKRKHSLEPEPDDYLSELAEEGTIRLADDGELPELSEDDLFYDEKPKRSEEER